MDPKAKDEVALLSAAAARERPALDEVLRRFALNVRAVLREGRRRYAGVHLSEPDAAAALARVTAASIAAESAAGSAQPLADALAALVPADVYLSEALLLGRPAAWTAFESILDGAWRAVRSHASTAVSRAILEEI